MKKKLKCVIITIQIIFSLSNLICPNVIIADELENNNFKDVNEQLSNTGKETTEQITNEGTAEVKNSSGKTSKVDLQVTENSNAVLTGLICCIFGVIPVIVNGLMMSVVRIFQLPSKPLGYYFLIEDIVFNKYSIFDINFLNTTGVPAYSVLGKYQNTIAVWYFSIRNIAIVANCFILIYIGIRMAISTVGEKKAKYKKMLINWFISVIIVYFMHYIIIVLFSLHDFFIDLIKSFAAGTTGFEKLIMENSFGTLVSARGWDQVPYLIILYVFMYYELKFFIMYIKRTFSVGFLFIVSPLITITYAIDAVKDGKSQVFNRWLREFIYNIFIQAIHAIVYTVFIISVGEIVKEIPLFGIFLFLSLSRAEKIVEKTFKLSSSITRSESILAKIKNFKLAGHK